MTSCAATTATQPADLWSHTREPLYAPRWLCVDADAVPPNMQYMFIMYCIMMQYITFTQYMQYWTGGTVTQNFA